MRLAFKDTAATIANFLYQEFVGQIFVRLQYLSSYLLTQTLSNPADKTPLVDTINKRRRWQLVVG